MIHRLRTLLAIIKRAQIINTQRAELASKGNKNDNECIVKSREFILSFALFVSEEEVIKIPLYSDELM